MHKAVKVDVKKNEDACINNEIDREDVIRFLLSEPEDCWAVPNVRDGKGKTIFYYAKQLSKKTDPSVDYMEKYVDFIEENEDRESGLQDETRPPPWKPYKASGKAGEEDADEAREDGIVELDKGKDAQKILSRLQDQLRKKLRDQEVAEWEKRDKVALAFIENQRNEMQAAEEAKLKALEAK